MKSIIRKTMTLVAIAIALLSFSSNFGGEGFEISLNGKVLLQRYGSEMNTNNSLQLNQNVSAGQLTIKYHHCGRVGKNRIVSIKDGQNKTVKEWRYTDANSAPAVMNCNVKDILNLKKGNESTFKLYYSSSELPNGRLLTTIVLGSNAVAKL